MRRLITVFAAGLLAAACADPSGPAYDETEAPIADDGKADAAAELYVRAGDTSLWVSREIARREAPGGAVLVLHGRTSRTIRSGLGFVADDPYGDFAIKSARTFEITWPVDTARTLADGVNQFVQLGFAPSAGRPDALAARIVARPRLLAFTGSAQLYLTAELTPVVSDGVVVYRVKGHASTALANLTVTAGGVAVTTVRRTDDTHFEIDLPPPVAFAIAGSAAPAAQLDLVATRADTFATLEKHARLGLAVKKLGVTAADPYDLWPRPTCTTPMRTCLTALPDGALDLAGCGEALEVLACQGQVGTTVDDVAFQAALHDGTTRTASAAFRADAAALVGAARVEALAGGAEQTVEAKLEPLFARWYLTTTARTGALRAAVDAAFHDTYARPLDLVEPTAPAPGDAATARQIAADALLAELAHHDFVATELQRTYDELVATYTAEHVASLRELRETAPVEPYPGMPGVDVVTGHWLGAYIEVAIERATGTARSVLIEID